MVNQSDLPELAAIFKAAIAAHLAPLQAEVAVLKARLEERPVAKDGAPGRDGKDAPPVDVEALFLRLKDAIPAPLKGEPGTNGKDGRDGVDGKDGRNGVDGVNGKDGKDGVDGKDAAPVDTADIVSRVLAKLPPPVHGKDGVDGKDGANGLDGKDGAPGRDGKDGRDGIDGKDARPVDPFVVRAIVVDEVAARMKELPAPKDGRDGRDGKDGRDGTDGAAGRDGSALEYLSSVDPNKSYPRGTHAIHAGGILYAERATDPVRGGDLKAAGWRMLIGGVASVETKLQADGRTFEFTFRFADGTVTKQYARTDIPAHRGVWRDAVTYEKADVVQWSGNAWIAREVTTDKPGDSKAWELLARRGRDGKDA